MSSPSTDEGRPKAVDLLRMHGSDFSESYAFVDDNDDPVDITDWTQLEGDLNRVGSGTVVASFAFDREDDEGGTGVLSIPGFADLPVGSYSYFVRYRDSLGKLDYAGRGVIRISKENP